MPEKILIVDDDLDTLRLVGLMLQKKGYQIVAANNGKQGLLKVAEDIPDLILLDVMMPEMDGYEVARRLRENPETANIPILMFTAKSQLDDKVTGFEAGADDYLKKPTHPAELHAHLKALLALSLNFNKNKPVPVDQKTTTVGIISARGGLGVSSIALNLGSLLGSNMEKETIVLELQQGMGSMGRDLGFTDFGNIRELLKKKPKEITKEVVEEALFEYIAGVRVLPASEEPKDALFNNAIQQSGTIFSRLSSLAYFVIVDFGAGLPSLNQALLPQCDQIIVLIESFSNSIAQAKLLIKNLLELGIEEEKILIVLNNRMRSDLLLPRKQVNREIGSPLAMAFTPAPELFSQANKKNTTAVIEQPNSITAQHFHKLANIIIEHEAKEA